MDEIPALSESGPPPGGAENFWNVPFLQVSGITVTSATSVHKVFLPFATMKLICSFSPYKMSIWINIFHRAVQNRTRRHFQ